MGSRDTYRRNTKNTSVSQNIHQTNPSGTISTSQHFKVNNRSSDKHASAQSNPANRKPFNKVISEPPCNVAETDLTKTKGRNYSSRNMLRNSRPATSNQMAEQRETSTSHNVPEDALPSQNLDSLSSYIKLTDDSYCFTYETQDGIICLLCGKKVVEKSINHHIYSNYHIDQFKKLDLELLYEELDESSFQMSTVKAFCDSWYSSSSLTDDLVLLRNHAIIEFEGILKSINPECRLRIHGSTYYGAALQQSDVNLELIHPNSKLFDSDPRSKKSAHHILIDPDAEYGNQFNQHTMDYDLAPNPVETLYKIHRIITDSSRSLTSYPFTVTSSLSKLNQNIPNITLSHRITNTTLNVTCYSERRFNLAQLLRVYLLLDSRAEQLSTLVKIWANACGIDNPDRGSYPPHAYVIMMIYFLQRSEPPVLPCLHDLSCSPSVKTSDQPIDGHENDEDRSEEGVEKINEVREDDLEDDEEDILTASLDQNFLKDLDWKSENKSPVHVLFMQFLKTMTDELSATANVITIRTLKKQSSLFAPHSKAIIHPIHPGTNISRCIASMKTFEYIKDCFFHSYFYLSSLPVDQNIKPRNIIKSDPRDYISLYVNARRLDSYRAMKEPSIGKANYNPIMQMVQQKLFARDVETLYALSTRIHVNLSQTLANLFDLGYMRPQNITYSYSCHLCRATGHWREKCPKARIETLHQETTTYDSSLDASANFDSELMKLYQKEAISSQLSSEHNRILGSLKRIINEALDLNLNFVLYGSTVNNLGSCESDLDICVTVKDNPTGKDVDCVNILKSILDVLRTITEVHQIQPVFSARVPIIRFKYNDFDIDMSMYNQCAIYNSKLLKAYSMINPKVAPLCSLVKKFAKVSLMTPFEKVKEPI